MIPSITGRGQLQPPSMSTFNPLPIEKDKEKAKVRTTFEVMPGSQVANPEDLGDVSALTSFSSQPNAALWGSWSK
jgi:hypothetical protein